MRHGVVRALLVCCTVVVLGSLAFHLVAGTVCLSARSVSGCQRCCQADKSPEAQGQIPTCGVFCCTGLPRALDVPPRDVGSYTVRVSCVKDCSECMAPALPPPKSWLSIRG